MGQRRMYGGKNASIRSKIKIRQRNNKNDWKAAHEKPKPNKKFTRIFLAIVIVVAISICVYPLVYMQINYNIEEVTVMASITHGIDTSKIPNHLNRPYRAIRKDGSNIIVFGNDRTLHWAPPYRAKIGTRKKEKTYGEILEVLE